MTSDIPQPALATLSHERFWEDGWVYERKLDGQRCLAVRDGRGTRLYSRSGRDVTVAFPEIAEALEEQASTDFVIDGEVVAFEGSRTSFAKLQPRIHLSSAEKARRSGVPVFFYVFDVLRADGEDVRGEPLLARKKLLRELLTFEGPVRYTNHRRRGGEDYFAEACRKGWEGLIAKREDAAYATGRTDRWLKFKCEAGQELVVVGWTDPEGSRVALGALLLGYYDGEDLVYAGKVGTGFSTAVLRDQLRLGPVHRLARQRALRARRLVDLELRQPGVQVAQHGGGEAGADLPGVHEVRTVVVAQQQRAESHARPLGVGPAHDDQLLARLALELEPPVGAPGGVRRVLPLRDQPLPCLLYTSDAADE